MKCNIKLQFQAKICNKIYHVTSNSLEQLIRVSVNKNEESKKKNNNRKHSENADTSMTVTFDM